MHLFRRCLLPSLITSALFTTLVAQPILNSTAQAQIGDPLGEIVFASNRDGDFDIYLMNGEGGEIRQLTDDDASDTTPRWSPDGAQIAFLSQRDNRGDNLSLYVMDADGGHMRSLSNAEIGITDTSFDWSPDGTQITFAFDPNYVFDSYTTTMDIFAVDVESGETTQITNNEYADADPKWSPDGAQIAFLSYIADDSSLAQFPDLFVVDVASRDVRRLTEDSASDVYHTWSADGGTLMFTSYGFDGANVMLADMESGTIAPITDLALGNSFDAQWSPNGRQIMLDVRYFDERGTELGLLDADGNSYIVLAHNEYVGFDADWSPDGAQIVYISDAEEDSEIYIVNADGTANKRLTDNEFSDIAPEWRPTLLE